MLLDAGEDFAEKHAHDKAFSVIAGVKDSSPLKINRMWVALALGAAMIITQVRILLHLDSKLLENCNLE